MTTDVRLSVDISALLTRKGYALVPGRAFTLSPHGQADAAWLRHRYAALPLDRGLPDGGTYRYRRHGRFTVLIDPVSDLPVLSYHPPPTPTVGGDPAPLGPGLERNRFLTALLQCAVAQLPPSPGWEIDVHLVRVTATPGRVGKPSPYGPHREGADFVSLHLVDLSGASVGGVTEIRTPDGGLVLSTRLTNRLDSLFLDDRALLHDVTPLAAVVGTARHDTLLVTYRALGSGEPRAARLVDTGDRPGRHRQFQDGATARER